MNVKKAEVKRDPGYPTKRQLAKGAKALGLVASVRVKCGAGRRLRSGCVDAKDERERRYSPSPLRLCLVFSIILTLREV